MAQTIASPRAFFSDEEEAPVFESTAAEFGSGICKRLLSDFSVISPGEGNTHNVKAAEVARASSEDCSEKVKIYLRVRPFTDPEQEKGEDQGCVFIENSATLLLHAPKDSFTMKNTERGIGQSVHKFTFSQILGPETTQKQFFDATMKEVVKDVLEGENRLVYTYGVTNSGKTYTIQGTNRDGGILPRSLSVVFNSIQGKLYSGMDLKPSLCNEVIWLESKQVMQEELKKSAFLKEDDVQTPMKKSDSGSFRSRFGTSSFDSGIGFSAASQLNSQLHSQLEDSGSRCKDPDVVELRDEGCVQYSVWVSFFEIYNEFLYDLLDTVPSNQNRKRQTLRLCEDKYGNPYVKDLNWINVSSAEDAWKVLKVGRKNQSFASTNLNHCSSRSHSIFSIRILHINGDPESDLVPKISELSLCDLAGSERCKEQKSGDRMKEANNINTSLHTLGRCIAALRQNQQQKTKQNMVPFRDSKLTRAFQGFFCGRGKSCMIVNINQCASMYDETLQALKFSAIATQLVHAPPSKTRVAYIQSLLREHGMRTNDSLAENEEAGQGEESDDEGDITVFDTDSLLNAIEVLKENLIKEKREKLTLEFNIREQVFNEMMEHINERENQFSEILENEKEMMEERYENKIQNLQESLKKYYQQEIQERDDRIEELMAVLQNPSNESKLEQSFLDMSQTQHESPCGVRRSKRIASSTLDLRKTNIELELVKTELQERNKELKAFQELVTLPPSASALTSAVDRKLEDGQKNIRTLRSELQKLGESLQSAERACCRNTSAEKLRHTLHTCDEILLKQDQTLAELQNNMILVKMDLKKKTVCIAEQYHTVHALKEQPNSCKKRGGANMENQQPEKRSFLRTILKTPLRQQLAPAATNSPYSCLMQSRQNPPRTTPSKYRMKY
ncbi:kinesin-like protein KIF20A isoform X1 [Polyodon spathula]|uniref:kinesin-like protein KIF20A isoform X1 n=1 Tax=Polyodon spathula TaxID=7913 RepID=UPI001B7F759B|nr:kinesin-like protein KIF20A isoform X1 [Polyodon spathula]